MQIHQLKFKSTDRASRRVGRGGKRGTYSGRGVKGYLSRSGSKKRPGFVGGDTPYFKRLPKQRGQGIKSIYQKHLVLNLSVLEKNFKSGEEVSLKSLIQKDLLRASKGQQVEIKILGDGELTKNLTFKDCLLSKSAKAKIDKAGGKIIQPVLKDKQLTK